MKKYRVLNSDGFQIYETDNIADAFKNCRSGYSVERLKMTDGHHGSMKWQLIEPYGNGYADVILTDEYTTGSGISISFKRKTEYLPFYNF